MSSSRRSARIAVALAAVFVAACSGSDGRDGKDGTSGSNGTNGSDGLGALVVTSTEAAGANCAYGGTKIETGQDADADGVLDAAEVSSTRYVCSAGFPSVSQVAPAPDAAEIPVDTAFQVVFTTRVDPTTVSGKSVTLVDGEGAAVEATVTYDDTARTATLVPTLPLVKGNAYVLSVSSAVRDLAGAILLPEFSATYVVNVDHRAPAIVATSPADGGEVALYGTVRVTFDEVLDESAAAGARFEVKDGEGAPVAGSVSYDASRAALVFTPDEPFTEGERYEARVRIVAADTLGNFAQEDRTWTFTAATPVMTAAPTFSTSSLRAGEPVTVTIPVNAATQGAQLFLTDDLASGGVVYDLGDFASDGEGLVTATFTVPSGMSLGSYALAVVAYDEASYREYYWDSAVSVANYATYAGAGEADSQIPLAFLDVAALTVPNLEVTIDGVTAGTTAGAVEVAWTVKNVGDGDAGASALGLFADGREPGAYYVPDAWIDVPAIAAGASVTGTTPVSGATTRVWAVADLAQQVGESNEHDNAASMLLVTSVTLENATATPIADDGYPTDVAASIVEVAGLDQVHGVIVKVNVTHTYDADLVIDLVSPAGTTIRLADGVGGGGEDFAGTVFDDAALIAIDEGAAPFTGMYRPFQALSTFAGEAANGTWTLRVGDAAWVDVGTLTSWSLTIW